MRSRDLLLSAAVVAALTATRASDVSADTGVVLVVGKAKPHHRQVVTSAVNRTVRDAAWSVSDIAFSDKEVETVMACVVRDRPWPCVEPTARDKGFQRMVIVQVDPEPADRIALIGQIVIAGDSVPPTDRRQCDRCSDASLGAAANELTQELLKRAAARTSGSAIDVRTKPDGAAITLDGQMIGSTDRVIPTSPGTHTLRLQRSGYLPASRSITVAEGETVVLELTLVPGEPIDGHRGGGSTRSRLTAGIVGGAGAVAIAGGLWYSLSRDPPDARDQPKYLYSGPALGVIALGGVALGIGVYLWVTHPGPRPTTTSTPTVSIMPGGGAVGWTTSF